MAMPDANEQLARRNGRTAAAVFAAAAAAAMAANFRVFPFPLFYFGLFVLGMRLILRARGVRAPFVTAAYLLFGAFTVFQLSWHALRGRVLPPLQGLALFPEITALCAVATGALLGAAALRRRFSPWYLLDALIFFNMLGPALAAPYRSTDWGCGSVTNDGLIFLKTGTAHRFGVAFSPDGETLYYSSREPDSRLYSCNVDGGGCVSRNIPNGEIYRLFTDARRARLIALMYPGPDDARGPVSDTGSGSMCQFEIGRHGALDSGRRLSIPAEFPVDAAFSPDARRLAVAHKYGTLHILDADTGAVLASHDFGATTLYRTAWDRDGRRVFVSSPAGRVHELDADARPTGREAAVALSAAGVAFAPDADILYVAAPFAGRVRAFGARSLRPEASLRSRYLAREVAAAPGRVIAGSYKSGRADVFDARTGARLRELRFGKMTRQIAVSPDGRRAAAVSYCGVFAFNLK